MFLRAKVRKKDGKQHRYFSVVENRRVGPKQKRMAQRTVLYLGEINDGQEAAWRKSLEVFDESCHQYANLSLFPEDREIPAEASNSIQVKLSQMELRRPRMFGNCWLGCELWRQLQLQEFWEEKLSGQVQRETVSWEKVLRLLVVNRLIDPGSEFRLHRQWFDQTAMAELLEVDFAVAEKDRLYRCLDRILEHKQALFVHLRQRWQDLFAAQFDVLLYDLTSTYIEGEGQEIPKAKYGYSRDQRFDCKQVVIALVITPEGFPLAYEVMEGNTSDKTTLRAFLDKIEAAYGRARRVWLMDRGIPTEAALAEMRASSREVFYLVGTRRSKIRQYEEVVGSAVAEGAGGGGSETVCRRGRAVCAGQERRTAGQRESHAAQEGGSAVAQVARDAPQWSSPRSAVVAPGRRQEGGGRRGAFRADPGAARGPAGNAAQFPFPGGQAQTAQGRGAGRSLSAALQPGGREPRCTVGALCATDPN